MLWFDVESKYEATSTPYRGEYDRLWFDVESKYEATERYPLHLRNSCGLM